MEEMDCIYTGYHSLGESESGGYESVAAVHHSSGECAGLSLISVSHATNDQTKKTKKTRIFVFRTGTASLPERLQSFSSHREPSACTLFTVCMYIISSFPQHLPQHLVQDLVLVHEVSLARNRAEAAVWTSTTCFPRICFPRICFPRIWIVGRDWVWLGQHHRHWLSYVCMHRSAWGGAGYSR